ncbi:MAG: dihydropteroate synthase [Ignavibacteriaceae bacterium]|nr:dihydropteroate synthase [Ignavibacteriaceae bacterium]
MNISVSASGKNLRPPVIMGILNVTPDSFSDGGKYLKSEIAFQHAVSFIESAVDIIDIGGESSRPGSEPVSAEEELRRIVPLISKITAEFPGTIVSVDTTKSVVAEAALDAGAAIINDISGGLFDSEMLELVAQRGCPYIIMHMKGTPQNMQLSPEYNDVIAEVYDFLNSRLTIAREMGISDIIIDPGIGFGKRFEDNINLIKGLSSFKSLGVPILVGLSRKSFLGKLTGNEINQRDTGSVIAEAVSLMKGAHIIRTHNAGNARELKKLFSGMMIN